LESASGKSGNAAEPGVIDMRIGFFLNSMIKLVIALAFVSNAAIAQTSSFNYQGSLANSGTAANGNYDLEVALFDSLSGGVQIGSTQTINTVAVSNGLFAMSLDFGANAFNGENRFLEISVRPSGGGNFTQLSPRQKISSAPYAIKSLNAAAADNATNFTGTLAGDITGTQSLTTIANSAVTTAKIADANITDAKIAAVSGSKVTGTIPVAAVPSGNTNYIQNRTSQQTTTNFSISGNGTLGGGLFTGFVSSTGNGTFNGTLTANGTSNLNGNVNVSGNVGIGTPLAPTRHLEIGGNGSDGFGRGDLVVSGNGDVGAAITLFPNALGATGYSWISTMPGADPGLGSLAAYDMSAGAYRFVIKPSGRIGIGTTAPDQLLSVAGNASKVGGGSWATFSDARLKNIHGNFTRGLSALLQLQPIRFEYKPDNELGLKGTGEYIGFSAQEVRKVIPEAVSPSTKGYLQLNADPILWTMVNAIKEQQALIEQQQKQISVLRKLVCRSHSRAVVCK